MVNAKEQMAKAKEQAAKIGITKENAKTAGDAVYDGLKAVGTDCINNPIATGLTLVAGYQLDCLADDISTMADASAISAYRDINEYFGS